ncbi:MAG: metalloregulator ArsR/SmtB family transcription factor [bacterium]
MKNNTEKIAEIFKALSSSTRLKIVVGLIEKHECNVNKMAEGLGIAQPNVSQHLSILKNAGVIEGYRKGNQICYKVVNEFVIEILKNIWHQ